MGQIHYLSENDSSVLKSVLLNDENLRKLRNKKIWIDLHNPAMDELISIGSQLKIHPTTIEDLKNTNTRIKVETFSNYLLLIIYDIFDTPKGLEQREIDIVIGKNFIITANIELMDSLNYKKNEQIVFYQPGAYGRLVEIVFINYPLAGKVKYECAEESATGGRKDGFCLV